MGIDDSTRSALRELAKEGKREFDRGHFESAAGKFQQAYAAAAVPTLALWSARSQVKLGRLVAASELYRQALGLEKNELWVGHAQEQAQEQARQELAWLLPRLAHLTIVAENASPNEIKLSIDDEPVPSLLLGAARPTDPGRRHVVAHRGREVVGMHVSLTEGEQRQVVLNFESNSGADASVPPPASPVAGEIPGTATARVSSAPPPLHLAGSGTNQHPPQSPAAQLPTRAALAPSSRLAGQRSFGWLGIGVGATGLIVGSTAGLIVLIRHADYSPACHSGKCDSTRFDQGTMDSYNRWRAVSTIGFAVGAVGAVTGLTLLLTSPKEQSKAELGLWVSPTAAELRGRF
jgi:hypothetical protein